MRTIGNVVLFLAIGVGLGISAVDFAVGDTSTIGRVIWTLLSWI